MSLCSSFQSYEIFTKPTKHITVFLNGFRTEKYKIILDTKRKTKWHHVLNDITNKINPYFGLVKKLYSSESGITICSFTDLEDNGTYVASDNKRFQLLKGGYRNEEDKIKYFEHYLTGQLDRNNKRKKLTYVRCNLIVIYVFNNGKEKELPVKIVLSKEELQNWEQVLSFIALSIDTSFNTIKTLYNANGHVICGPWELQHGASYIAVGYHEKFIPRNYKIRENTTERWKNTPPFVYNHKGEPCRHKHGLKSWKQNLVWKLSIEEDLCIDSEPRRYKKFKSFQNCDECSSSPESKVNTVTLFSMPSDKYGCWQDSNSQLMKPPNNSHERKSHSFLKNKLKASANCPFFFHN